MKTLAELKTIDPNVLAILTANESGGHFIVNRKISVIVSWLDGWDHVSCCLHNRCPTWDEMEFVARLFFKDNEYAMQLHVPQSEYINCHPYVLHWWRPHKGEIMMPPRWMV